MTKKSERGRRPVGGEWVESCQNQGRPQNLQEGRSPQADSPAGKPE